MRTIGFAITKDVLWFSVLDGAGKTDAKITTVDKQRFNSDLGVQELMVQFYNLFNELLEKYSPDSVACKVHLDSNLSQIPYMHFSLGILSYICKLKNIPTRLRSGKWISAGKNAKQIACVQHFSTHKLRNEEIAATVVAWYEFSE